MKPAFQVIADSKDITDKLRDRLLSITITDKPGLDSDECVIQIDDRDNAVAFPKRGATLEVGLGYEGEQLTFVGKYRVDEIEVSGPPQSMTIRAKPADIVSPIKSQDRNAWEDTTLVAIVDDIARRNGLEPRCNVEASVPRVDQINESDLHFITRLARRHGATATVKDGKLIVASRGQGQSGGGAPLPAVRFTRSDLASYTLTFPDRPLFGKTRATHHNTKTGKLEIVDIDNTENDGPTYTDRHVYPSKAEASAAAQSRVEALNRATTTGRLELAKARADLGAELWLELSEIKDEVDGRYLIESVEQHFTRVGWITTIVFNAGNQGKGGVGRKKQKKNEKLTILQLSDE